MAYAGLYKHDVSDLYLATYRAYNSTTARWLNRDPIREAGGLNVYAYVGGDPVSKLDLLGLDWIFSYSEGSLVRVDENNKSIDKPFKGVYAGAPGYKNDSESQSLKDKGPIPEGTYEMTEIYTGPTKATIRLKPDPSNEMYGRDAFLIHGDNSTESGSQGCIILNGLSNRQEVWNKNDRILRVVK